MSIERIEIEITEIVEQITVEVYEGRAAKNPYELAVLDGFEGSLSEWLESLKGRPGEDLRAFEKRHHFVAPYSYCARAPYGSSENAQVWHIERIQILEDGSTDTKTATNVNYTDHLTHTYS